MAALNEAFWAVYRDEATIEDVDAAMSKAGFAMGAFELADEIGIDTVLNKLKELYAKYSDERYSPCPLLEEYLSKSGLGQKTKWGFYKYD